MSRTWLYILGVMVAGHMIIRYYPLLLVALAVHAAIFIIAYLLLRRDPFLDLRASMLFIFGLTVINILADLGMMNSTMANIAFVALFVWSMAGGGRNR